MIKIFKLSISIILLIIGLSIIGPFNVQAAEFYQSSMAGDAADHYRVAGLTFSIQDEAGPSLIMNGGVLPGQWDMIGPFPFMFGRVKTDIGGGLISQTPNNVANKLLFNGDLSISVSRLSPALLLETNRNILTLFAPDIASASANISNIQQHLASPSLQKGTTDMFMIPVAVLGGTIKPLRYAVPKADGTIATGVLGSQAQVNIPVTGVQRVVSQAPAPSAPPLDQINNKWILLWYGADSSFVHTKTPLAYLDNTYHINYNDKYPKPWWAVRSEAYQADIPILIILNDNPSSIIHNQNGVSFNFTNGSHKMAVMPLFGGKILKAADTEKWLAGLPADVINQANDWTNRLSYYPNNVQETVAVNTADNKVTFTENVTFSQVRTGNPQAPLPVMLALAYHQGLPALSFSVTPTDTKLPTEFGPIFTIPGNSYSWSISGLGKYIKQGYTINPSNSQSTPFEQLLSEEVNKIIQAGHLSPYIFTMRGGGTSYFRDPSETLYFLADVFPLLSSAQQAQIKDYLTAERNNYKPEVVNYLAYRDAAASRVVWDTTLWKNNQRYYTYNENIPRDQKASFEINEYWENSSQSLYRAYGLSRYYDVTGGNPQTDGVLTYCQNKLNDFLVGEEWDTLNWYWGKYTFKRWDVYLENSPRSVQRNLAGVVGCLNLYKQVNQTAPDNFWKIYAKLSALRFAMTRYNQYQASTGMVGLPENPTVAQTILRWNDFTKSENYQLQVRQISQYAVNLGTGASWRLGFGGQQQIFRDMVPETARMLRDWGLGPDIQRFLDFYGKKFSDWYRYKAPVAEGHEWRLAYPSDSYQLFMAHAWIAKTPADQLARYVDIPWMERGDFYYLQKLSETVKAYRGIVWQGEIPVGPCTLSAASWSITSVTQGNSINLNVAGTGSGCAGKQVSFEVRRNGTILDDILADIQPQAVILNSLGQAVAFWVAEFKPLIPGTQPQYYFKAKLAGGNTIESNPRLLTVSQ